jgi:hypothetical protein
VDWFGVYAGIIAATGWTWEYIDENMTLARLAALNEHWDRFPPTHKALARLCSAFLKEEPKHVAKSDNKKGTLSDLMAMFGKSGGTIKP